MAARAAGQRLVRIADQLGPRGVSASPARYPTPTTAAIPPYPPGAAQLPVEKLPIKTWNHRVIPVPRYPGTARFHGKSSKPEIRYQIAFGTQLFAQVMEDTPMTRPGNYRAALRTREQVITKSKSLINR